MRACLGDSAVLSFDAERRDKVVGVVLGRGFLQLASPTEVNQNLVAAGEPPAPPQCLGGR